MRRFVVFLTLVLLLALSVATGWLAAYWPQWCRVLDLCTGH